mmetsp:Transcript_12518/g.46312  ORF Transcript_12518/g.46312 Transcript_12518/m.46312 type:complete len:365 (-) Transcript_12518:188-1282(-)
MLEVELQRTLHELLLFLELRAKLPPMRLVVRQPRRVILVHVWSIDIHCARFLHGNCVVLQTVRFSRLAGCDLIVSVRGLRSSRLIHSCPAQESDSSLLGHPEGAPVLPRTAKAFDVASLLLISDMEDVTDAPLHQATSPFADFPFKPLGMRDSWYGIFNALHRRRNTYHFLNRRAEALFIVVPINHLAHIDVLEAVVFQPLPEELSPGVGRHAHRKDRHWDGASRDGSACWQVADDEVAIEAPVLDHLRSEEVCQSICRRQSDALLPRVLLNSLGNGLPLGDQLEELFVVNAFALGVEHVKPVIRDRCHDSVALVQRRPLQKHARLEDLRLEGLYDLELPSALQLESFQLGERPVVLKHCVSLL